MSEAKVQVNLYAAARDALGAREIAVAPNSIEEIFAALAAGDHYKKELLLRCSVLIDGERCDDLLRVVQAGESLDILPPFAGGQ